MLNSPKRLHELAKIMEKGVRKPDRATGTTWAQHKTQVLKSLIVGYDVILAHLNAMASTESCVRPVDEGKLKSYWTIVTNNKFVLYVIFFYAMFNPLAALSCPVHGSLADLSLAIAKLKALKSAVAKLTPKISTKLSQIL